MSDYQSLIAEARDRRPERYGLGSLNEAETLITRLVQALEDDAALNQKLLTAAGHALRSYQYGNASPELAREVADAIDKALVSEHVELREMVVVTSPLSDRDAAVFKNIAPLLVELEAARGVVAAAKRHDGCDQYDMDESLMEYDRVTDSSCPCPCQPDDDFCTCHWECECKQRWAHGQVIDGGQP